MRFFFGKYSGGSKRWLALGFLRFQPSEMAKLTIIIVLAKTYAENLNSRGLNFQNLLKPFIIVSIPALFVLKQPDLGTVALFFIIAASVTLFVKIEKKTLISLLFLFVCLVPVSWSFLKAYQKKRILTLIFPDKDPLGAAYQIIQSKIAIGSGMLTGKGFLNGTQKLFSFLPEQHTDFIWSVITEEMGFIGSSFVLLCFFIFFWIGFSIVYNCDDHFGSILGLGIISMIFWQFFINICMVMGFMPIVGMGLPFISYGGSSIIINMICVGILLNISMRRFDKLS